MITFLGRFKFLVILALATGQSPAGAAAIEPVDQFLEVLRQRRLYDEALAYAEFLPSMDYVPERIRQKALYEQGLTWLASASAISDAKARQTQSAKAVDAFEKFEKFFPAHPLVGSAKSQIGNVLVERGRAEVRSVGQAADKQAALTDGRRLFEQARQQFETAEKLLDAEAQKMPKLIPAGEAELQSLKQQVAGDLLQARMLRASVDQDLASTYAASSAEARKHLQAAAKGYATIYQANRISTAGAIARLWEGRCYQELDELRQALGCYQQLMDSPGTPESDWIKARSTRDASSAGRRRRKRSTSRRSSAASAGRRKRGRARPAPMRWRSAI